MEEANKIMEEALEDAGFEVTKMLPEDSVCGCGKKLAIAGGIGFVAGIVATKVAKPVAKWVKSKFKNKEVTADDFECVEDADFEDLAEEKTE